MATIEGILVEVMKDFTSTFNHLSFGPFQVSEYGPYRDCVIRHVQSDETFILRLNSHGDVTFMIPPTEGSGGEILFNKHRPPLPSWVDLDFDRPLRQWCTALVFSVDYELYQRCEEDDPFP